MTSWDKRFIELAHAQASYSKDRKKKVGAVIVSHGRYAKSTGYNGMPIGCNDDDETRHVKPKKLFYFEHAERNAIYTAAKLGISTDGCTMYLTWHPCADCARAIIQSGIKRVVCYEPDWNDDSWGETFQFSREMMKEAGVQVEYHKD
jgi:dCMP deaminase